MLFRTPVDLRLRLPDIGAAAAEPESLEAHRFQRHVAGEDHQVGPGNFAAVLLLDRPEQPARLVQIHVVGPAVQRRESLRAPARAAASIVDAVRAGGMPGHADQERAVVAEIGRPPILRIRHQCAEILNHRIQVKAVELLGVVELSLHRIGQRGVADAEFPDSTDWATSPCSLCPCSCVLKAPPENGHFASLDMMSPVIVCKKLPVE